jgi:hypothetical protein
VKGPDVMGKSKHTQCCYRKTNHNQKTLDAFVCSVHRNASISSASGATISSAPVIAAQDDTEATILPVICEESIEVEIPPVICGESVKIQIPLVNHDRSVMDGWEEDLDKCVGGNVWGWDVLQEQIKMDMKKGGNTLPLTKINQLLVLRTLQHFS